jgi:hypothetical protein
VIARVGVLVTLSIGDGVRVGPGVRVVMIGAGVADGVGDAVPCTVCVCGAAPVPLSLPQPIKAMAIVIQAARRIAYFRSAAPDIMELQLPG